jgi:hypothetical protein
MVGFAIWMVAFEELLNQSCRVGHFGLSPPTRTH